MDLLVDENVETEWVQALRDDGHDDPGVIVIADVTRTGGQVRRAVRRIEQSVSDLSDHVAYVSDWL